MAEQETLSERTTFNPLDHGLWARYRAGNEIDHAAWMRACAEGSFVGTCRRCGDYLIPSYPDALGKRTDYEASCRRRLVNTIVDGKRVKVEGCEWTLNAPGGRILERSSRHHEMPPGWWSRRMRAREGGDG